MRSMRLDTRAIAAILATLGNPHFRTDTQRNARNDANETATFTRKLEYVIARTYDKKYPDLRARDFLPVNSEVPSGAESFVWRSFDYYGQARIIANFADDLPLVDIIAGEQAQILRSVGDGYHYSVQDLRQSAMAGTQLDAKRAQAARKVCENTVEKIAALGDSVSGLPGFLNNPNVTLLTAPGDINGNWGAATPQQILDDLNTMVNKMVETTKGAFSPDTILLPLVKYNLISSKVMSVNDSRTILDVFLQNQKRVTSVDTWNMLDKADAAGTGPRAVVYQRDAEIVELVIPQEFEQFPPQPFNLAFKVPCHMRIGGVVVYYPLGVMYVDGI